MRKLFGTDGIRGVAGEFPLDEATTYDMGRALGDHVGRRGASPRVVIGRDTRLSSAWIADSVAAGLTARGVQVVSASVITTPGVAYLARSRGFDAGVVISASHNPWTDNGIKVFGGDGYKLPDDTELQIEHELFQLIENSSARTAPGPLPAIASDQELRRAYVEWLSSRVHGADLAGLHVVADCANGAASPIVRELFRAREIRGEFLHNLPDGCNINEGCGALHPDVVARAADEASADLGVSFDGDADRAMFATTDGRVVNGDGVLLLMARAMKSRGELDDLVVATTMSNMGLEIALQRAGIRMARAPVGDKYVLEEMRKTGASLGGEQSGHIIFAREATTGDGLLTALKVMEVMARSGRTLSELVQDLEVFPQILRNVRVREKKPLDQIAPVAHAIRAAELDLRGRGRVVVRYSGTEPLARVMIEASTSEETHRWAEEICAKIQQALGV